MSLAQLPDELLVSIFGRLSLEERHRALPLVSQRCWRLLCSPQLLHAMRVYIHGDADEEAVPRLRSLARFLLLRGAGSVRQLRLDLGSCGEEEHDTQIECMALLAAAATACSGLEDLQLQSQFTVTLSSWLLPLRGSLRALRTVGFTCTIAADSLGLLTALQELEMGVYADYVTIEEDARLPTSLTRLVLGSGPGSQSMPHQIGTLCNLRQLFLQNPYEDAGSYAPLTRLSRLTTLKLLGCVPVVPDCLSALTSLLCLAVEGRNMDNEEEAAVAAGLSHALPHLVQLTQLDLDLSSPGPLASLTALTALRQLSWWAEPDIGSAALPHGPWMQRLEALAAPDSLLAHSLPALEGARSLQQLCSFACRKPRGAQLRSVIRWAVQHPTLQRLLLGDRPLSSELWPEIGEAARVRPDLRIMNSTIAHIDC